MLTDHDGSKIGRPLAGNCSFEHLLFTLACEVERLAPSHRDPHAFHEAKSEIAHALRRLAGGYLVDGRGAKGLGPLRVKNVQLVRVKNDG